MVFFTCNNCGESVKKPAVEKHYNTKCRGKSVNVSCMDCLNDFGDDFVKHTKCISELQKYSGKNFVAKESNNSGEKKQESWMNIVHSILESTEYELKPDLRGAFQKLQNMENVPRKKAKFENYTKSCLRFTKPTTEKVWAILEKELEKIRASQPAKEAVKRAPEENGHIEPANKKIKKDNATETNDVEKPSAKNKENGHNESVKKKSKKAKGETSVNDTNISENDVAATGEEEGAFEWSSIIEKLVAKKTDGIALEKLKAKVLKKYLKKVGSEDFTEKKQNKFEKKFTKHLKKCPQIQMENDFVRSC